MSSHNRIKPAEALFIQEHIREGRELGETVKQIRAREQWLARQFDCNARTIRTYAAQTSEKVSALLEDEYFSQEETDFARAMVVGLSGEDRREVQQELAEEMNVSIQVIQAATDGIRALAVATIVNGKRAEHAARAKIDDVELLNNPTRRRYRGAWKSFLAAGIPRQERAGKNILCLPGEECLEIPLYGKLGFSLDRVVGIEGGERLTRAKAEKSSAAHGIQLLRGRLEELVYTKLAKHPPFDVAHLDFQGPICDTYMDILKNLHLADDAFLGINVAGKREKLEMQEYLRSLRTNTPVSVRDVLQRPTWNEQLGALRHFFLPRPVPAKQKSADEETIAREEIVEVIMQSVGTARPENKHFSYAYESVAKHPLVGVASGEIMMQLAKALQHKGVPDRNALMLAIFALELTHHALRGSAFLSDLKQYSYKSERNGSPYLPQFMHIHTPRKTYADAQQTIDFFIQCLQHHIRRLEQAAPSTAAFSLRTHGSLASNAIRKSDTLYLVEGSQTIVSMPLRTFDADVMGAYQHLRAKDKSFRVFKGIREIL